MAARLVMLLAVAAWLGAMAAGQEGAIASGHGCTSSGTYNNGSQYEKNLAVLLAKLSSAAAAASNTGLFHNGSVGTAAADQASGLVMCYAGCNAAQCQDYLQEAAAAGKLTEVCELPPRGRNVSLLSLDGCVVRYADAPFFGSADTDEWDQGSSGFANAADVDVIAMNVARWQLLSQLAEMAARGRPLRLAQGSLPYTDARHGSRTTTVYGLVQCAGDLEAGECARCLTYPLDAVKSESMANATRGYVIGYSCYLRYQLDDPINVGAAPSPQPADAAPSGATPHPPGSKGGETPMVAAVAAAAGAVMLLVAGV